MSTIEDVRRHMIQAFERMTEVGAVIHPFVIDDFMKIAELLDIDPGKVPTEGQALERKS